MRYILGVDAGNTKTIALVATLKGQIVGWGRGGCGDIYNTGTPDKALANVDHAVQEALAQAGCRAEEIVAAAFSMAGADWPEDFALIETALKARPYGGNIVVVNDAIGGLHAGAVDGWGVGLTNGTGGAIGACSLKDADGQSRIWQTSFWQEGGGARSLGEAALKAVYRSSLGIEAPTALTERLLAFYGQAASVEDLLHAFSRREGSRPSHPPALARLVLDTARDGDATACSIVQKEGALLADYILAAARRVGIETGSPFPLIFSGSVFKHESALLPEAILARLHECGAAVQVFRSDLEPAAGALIIACGLTTVKINKRLRARLRNSSPLPDFFHT